MNKNEKDAARNVVIDIFCDAFHKAANKDDFITGMLCGMVDKFGVEQTIEILAYGVAFDDVMKRKIM